MAGTAAFLGGVRCWQFAKCLRAQPARGGQGGKVGISRRRARSNPRSPNFAYQIAVPCWMPSVDGDHAESVTSLTGAGRQVTRQVYMSKTLEFFIDNAGVNNGLHRLAWVQDTDEVLTVSVGATGGVVPVGVTGSGFVPASGDIIVARNPNTGEGVVTTVIGYSGGNITADWSRYAPERNLATGEPTTQTTVITTDWEIYKAQYYYDKADFVSMSDPEVPSQVEDKVVMAVNYMFQSEGGIVYPASMTPSF